MELPIPEDEATGLGRLIDRMLGHGFKLAIVEVRTPAERDVLVNWVRDRAGAEAEVRPVDLADLPGENVWRELNQSLGEVRPRTVLALWGLEVTERRLEDERAGLIQQLNVQRDVLVRDFPVIWVLFVHPSLREQLMRVAPDFCDFVTRWVEVDAPPAPDPGTGGIRVVGSFTLPPLPLVSPPSEGRGILEAGWAALERFDLDAARDAVSRLGLRGELPSELEFGRRLIEAWLVLHSKTAAEAEAAFAALVDDPSGTVLLRAVAGIGRTDALMRMGRLDAAREALQETRPRWGVSGDGAAWRMEGKFREMDLLLGDGHSEAAERIAREEMATGGETLSRSAEAGLLLRVGQALPREEALRVLRDKALPLMDSDLGRAIAVHEIAVRGDLEDALRVLTDEVVPVFEEHGDMFRRAFAWASIALAHQAAGRVNKALDVFETEVLPAYTRLGATQELLAMHWSRVRALSRRGEQQGAIEILRCDVLRLARDTRNRRSEAVTFTHIADLLYERGRLDEALLVLERDVLPNSEGIDAMRARSLVYGRIADIHSLRGRHDEALHIRRERALPATGGRDLDEVYVQSAIAEDLYARGDFDTALALTREILVKLEHVPDGGRLRAPNLFRVAKILARRGELDDALRVCRTEVLPKLGSVLEVEDERLRVVVFSMIAVLNRQKGRHNDAYRTLSEDVLPAFQRLGLRAEEGAASVELALVLLARGRRADRGRAQKLLRDALAIAIDLGLPLADQIREIQTQQGWLRP